MREEEIKEKKETRLRTTNEERAHEPDTNNDNSNNNYFHLFRSHFDATTFHFISKPIPYSLQDTHFAAIVIKWI